jgi:hypothetical protein
MASETICRVFDIDPKRATTPAIAVFILLAIFAVLRLVLCKQTLFYLGPHHHKMGKVCRQKPRRTPERRQSILHSLNKIVKMLLLLLLIL